MRNKFNGSRCVNFDDHVLRHSASTARGLEISSFLLTTAAFQRGLEVAFHRSSLGKTPRFHGELANGLAGSVFSIGDGSKTHYFNRTMGDKTSREASRLAQNKNLTKLVLARAGIRTPVGVVVRAGDTASAAGFTSASACRRFVVKPLRGSLSEDVHLDISAPEVVALISSLRSGQWMIEEFISGDEIRAYVVGEQCVGVAQRLNPTVTGNGIDTIARLVENKNKQREHNLLLGKFPFVFQKHDLIFLQKQGRCPDDVPPERAIITLSTTKSLLAGADTRNVEQFVNDSFRNVAVSSCKALGLPNAGLDIIISDDPARPGAFVLEANQRALIGSHSFPSQGPAGTNAVADAILDMYFPGSSTKCHFDAASFAFSSITQALQSCQVNEIKLPVLNADWHHCRINFSNEATAGAVMKILLSSGAYARLLNLTNGEQLADVLLPPESRLALVDSKAHLSGLTPQVSALFNGLEAGAAD